MGLDQTRRPSRVGKYCKRAYWGRSQASCLMGTFRRMLYSYLNYARIAPEGSGGSQGRRRGSQRAPACPNAIVGARKNSSAGKQFRGSGALQPRPGARALWRCLAGPSYFFLAKDLLCQLDEIVEDASIFARLFYAKFITLGLGAGQNTLRRCAKINVPL